MAQRSGTCACCGTQGTADVSKARVRIALVGNQNCGKTTLFNAMTGASQHVANWPGVTLDKTVGFVASESLAVTDLPGLYSLSPYSPEEIVSRNFLLSNEYDVIVNVVDATHLERSLSLTCQLLSFKRPVVLALNMMDLAQKDNLKLDLAALEQEFKVPVVALSAAKSQGLAQLYAAISKAASKSVCCSGVALKEVATKHVTYLDEQFVSALEQLSSYLTDIEDPRNREFVALALLQQDKLFLEYYAHHEELLLTLNKLLLELNESYGTDMESLLASQRYSFIDKCLAKAASGSSYRLNALSSKIDNILTHKFLALPIFALVVYLVYYFAVSTVGTMATDYANDVLFGEYATNAATALMTSMEAPEWLSGLVVDGIIGGVGAVLGFVPQMIVLFILLSILEQCGYMTRVAFVLDRLFRHFGLSGRSFIPMIVASGCGVPAIMASNGIDNLNEKRMSIITTTFVPCSAKLPILAMIAAAFFPESTWVAPLVYFVAIFSILFTALVLKKGSAFKEEVSPFVMELPNYTLPKLSNVLHTTYERCKAFVTKAGTIILSTVVLVWFLSSFNFTSEGFAMVEVGDSMLAAIGSAIAFIFIPLGFASWQAAVAIVTGLLAKENVVGTLAVLLGLGEVAEDDASLGMALHSEFTTSSAALAFLFFNLFSTPCIAALGAMKRQLNNPRLFAFAVVYMLGFAYILALVTYNVGGFIVGEVAFGPNTVISLFALVLAVYLVARPERKNKPSLHIAVKQI